MMVTIVVCLVFALIATTVLILTQPTSILSGQPGPGRKIPESRPSAESGHVDGAEPEWMNEVRNALANHQKIQAIKLYRKATGAGLREAKEAVEKIPN